MSNQYSEAELLDHIRDLADELGKVPTQKDMSEHGDRDPSTYYYRFGSWNTAIEKAGLEPQFYRSDGQSEYSDEELLTHIHELADELDKIPSRTEMDAADGCPASGTLSHRFGSWNAALEKAGFESRYSGNQIPISNEELLDRLRDLADELDKTPSKSDIEQHGEYSGGLYEYRFGSWSGAVEAAGFEPLSHESSPYSEAELLDYLRDLADELGKTPTVKEMEATGPPGPNPYSRRFGSWNEAVEAAGLEPNSRVGEPIDVADEELLDDIRRVADELGKTPSAQDMSDHGDYSAYLSKERFGSWNEAVEAAGLEPNRTPKAGMVSNSGASSANLIESLQEIALYLGRAPTKEDVVTYSTFDPEDFIDRFGSWWVAQSMANVTATDLAMLEDDVEEVSQ